VATRIRSAVIFLALLPLLFSLLAVFERISSAQKMRAQVAQVREVECKTRGHYWADKPCGIALYRIAERAELLESETAVYPIPQIGEQLEVYVSADQSNKAIAAGLGGIWAQVLVNGLFALVMLAGLAIGTRLLARRKEK
jgi:hypothetical protein